MGVFFVITGAITSAAGATSVGLYWSLPEAPLALPVGFFGLFMGIWISIDGLHDTWRGK